jgi:hypothetical protein
MVTPRLAESTSYQSHVLVLRRRRAISGNPQIAPPTALLFPSEVISLPILSLGNWVTLTLFEESNLLRAWHVRPLG